MDDTGDFLDALMAGARTEERPWGYMRWFNAPGHNVTVKYLHVRSGHRTSEQYHELKDELLIVLEGDGFVETLGTRWHGTGCMVRIPPGMPHRVTGPLTYLEISSYDDGEDTIRTADDYGRA